MSTAAASGAVDRLRGATRERHARLDVVVGSTVDRLDAAAYAALLCRMGSIVVPLEAAVTRAVAPDALLAGELAARRRSALIECDLRTLDAPMPAPRPVPCLDDPAAALGAAYVLEGSVLGGRVLAARARAALGPDAPVAFFTAGGADVPARWAAMRALLEARLVSDRERQHAVRAAEAVFDAFIDGLVG